MNVVGFKRLDDLLAELRDDPTAIIDKTVRFDWNRQPEQEELISFKVDCWATALQHREDADYLLEFGSIAGIDSEQADELAGEDKLAGTHAAAKARDKLAEACDDLALKLRPGKIEVF